MKKLLFLLFAFCGFAMLSACASDTHYDSVSTTLQLNLADLKLDGSEVTVRQRFMFDRDLSVLSSMTLAEAWLSAPDMLHDRSFQLDILNSANVYLVEDEEMPSIYWLVIPNSKLNGQDAKFSEFNVGDLRQYVDAYNQIELEITVSMEPYHAMRYWRDVCNMSEDCTIELPLSMQFKMED
ncbi:MAG: hypothetical protein II180_05545 [Proteobacteria bacterium]|nr:hypothetical protein [Pseudomonadota bacterium]